MDLHRQMFERITELVTLLGNYDFEPTVRKISEVTGATLEQTREDLGNIHRAGIHIYPEEVAEILDKKESRFDDEVLGLDIELPTNNPLLFLDREERSMFRGSGIGDMLIKDTPYSVPEAVRRCSAQIGKAIRERCYIEFRYRSPKTGSLQVIRIAPYLLFHNTTDDLYYCISFDDEDRVMSYRLDRIVFDVHLISTEKYADDRREELERLKYVWGAAFNNDEDPVHVKIEISASTSNIINKIKNDVRDRHHGSLRREPGKEGAVYIYEDDVIGLASFRAWVMTYGSSVKVLEPASLAGEILESSRQRLLNYEDGDRFH